MSVSELLKNAGAAVGANRLIEPAGNNAAEYYLAVLDKDSSNNAARDGLREMFPLATGAIEQQINAGQLDEGMRAITLLGRADPNNYTLTILRNKLDLKKKQMDRDQDKRDQEKTLAANAARNANTPATAAPPAAEPPPAAPGAATATTSAPTSGAAPATAAATPASSPVPAAAAPASSPVSAPAPSAVAAAAASEGAESRGATLVQKVNPNYPPDAARKHQEGWVEVGFTVGSDGHVKDATVVGANPARVFNEAALRAVESWTFQPRLEAGKPVEQHIKSRIEFKL
jgi:protein TonB